MNGLSALLSLALAFPGAFAVAAIGNPAPPSAPAAPRLTIVADGQARAEIVVAENRPRMVTLAALELRHFLEKISGARLPIVTRPTAGKTIKIYVGRSPGTDTLQVTAEGLRHGAFRIVSGPEWLVLLGRDYDFDPPVKPWPMSRGDAAGPLAGWEKRTQGKTDTGWGFPFAAGFKSFWNPNNFDEILSGRYGPDSVVLWRSANASRGGFWAEDEGGSLNAVYDFLHRLGVRWYMPGEIGQVVPHLASIAPPPVNETVKPDFAERSWLWNNFSGFSFDELIWGRRVGMNSGYENRGAIRGPHGMVPVHSHKAMQQAHPEYYALIGGKRDTAHRSHGTACFTSDGLFRETVNYVRFLFDELNLPAADIWPGDGLTLCQDKGCRGKSASELVWSFADRVAREVYKTHPERLITCGAYTSYVDPPDSIEKFSPNLGVMIANSMRPMLDDPVRWAAYWARIETWRRKIAPGNILRLENNRFSIWGDADRISFPIIHPHAMARDLKALKGISMGERGEVSQKNSRWHAPGIDHITMYVQARFLWDADQDIDALLHEYFTLFYGPAAASMQAAFTFAEQNLNRKDESRRGKGDPGNVTLATKIRFRDLLANARHVAGSTIYGERIQQIISELKPKEQVIAEHEKTRTTQAALRAKAPLAVGVTGADLGNAKAYPLRNNATGKEPAVQTTFRTGWDGTAICFDILCQEPEMKNLVVSGDVHSGDYIAVFLETPNHSFYHLEVNPDGVIVQGNPGPNWKSLAEVKTERGGDFWRIQLRIPVVGNEEANADPNHRVAGAKPTAAEPWFFNVGRIRTKEGKTERHSFSPTGGGWHVPEKFGKLQID